MKKQERTIQPFTGALYSDTPIRGQITVANASAADAAYLVQPLTDYVASIPGDDVSENLDAAFPAVPVARRFSFRKLDDQGFITENDDSDIRAVGAPFKEVHYEGDQVESKLYNKGLTYCLDKDEVDDVEGEQIRVVEALRKRLLRADYLRMISLLDGASTNAAKTWAATQNPDGDLRSAIETSHTKHGLRPSRVMIGETAWQLRQDSYEAAARVNHAMANHANYSTEELASYLNVDRVIREDSLYTTKKGATTKTNILAGLVYVYQAQDGIMREDPSVVKRFTGDTDAGGRFAVYAVDHPKFIEITVEHYSRGVITISKGVEKRTIS